MIETLSNYMTDMFTNLLVGYITGMLAPINGLIKLFASAGQLRDLTNQPWGTNLIAGAQGIAMAVLALRVAWEALQMASLRAEGAPTDPGALLKRTVMTAAAIFGGPWIARQMIVIGNLLAGAVARAGFGVGLDTLDLSSLVSSMPSPFEVLILLVPSVLLLVLIFFQSMIRTIEITLAAVISPLAALGYMSGGGMADVWWREVMVLSTAQAVQLLLVYLAAALLVSPAQWNSSQVVLAPFLFVAALWVAWRTPQILRNYAYASGARSVAGSVSQAAVWRVMSRMPF